MPLSIGQVFLNWQEFNIALKDWAIQEQFKFHVVIKDSKRGQYECQHSKAGCPWRLWISYNELLELEIKKLSSQHQCAGMGDHPSSSVTNQQSWLRRVIPQHLLITKSTKPQDIIDCVRMHYSHTTSYQAALKVKSYLLSDKREDQISQFQSIPPYLELLKA